MQSKYDATSGGGNLADQVAVLHEEVARLKEDHRLEIRRLEIAFFRTEFQFYANLNAMRQHPSEPEKSSEPENVPAPYVRETAIERLLFRRNGRPIKPFRRMLFSQSGRPRNTFKRLVFKKNGTPRRQFQQWLRSPAYQSLPGAYRFDDGAHG